MHFLDENFWLAISFLIFLYFAYKPIKKSILAALDAKIASIQTQILEVQALREEAQLLLKQTEQKIAQLNELKEKIAQETTESTNLLIAEQTKEIAQWLNHKAAEAAASVNKQKFQACREIQAELSASVTKLAAEYFKSLDDSSIPDSEIAKRIMNNTQSD